MPPLRRVVFFGSPDFALPTLDALARSRFRPILVVSQPPRPAGRGRRTEDTAVAARAHAIGLEVWQPGEGEGRLFLSRSARSTSTSRWWSPSVRSSASAPRCRASAASSAGIAVAATSSAVRSSRDRR
jgi:hypothetical protein